MTSCDLQMCIEDFIIGKHNTKDDLKCGVCDEKVFVPINYFNINYEHNNSLTLPEIVVYCSIDHKLSDKKDQNVCEGFCSDNCLGHHY